MCNTVGIAYRRERYIKGRRILFYPSHSHPLSSISFNAQPRSLKQHRRLTTRLSVAQLHCNRKRAKLSGSGVLMSCVLWILFIVLWMCIVLLLEQQKVILCVACVCTGNLNRILQPVGGYEENKWWAFIFFKGREVKFLSCGNITKFILLFSNFKYHVRYFTTMAGCLCFVFNNKPCFEFTSCVSHLFISSTNENNWMLLPILTLTPSCNNPIRLL